MKLIKKDIEISKTKNTLNLFKNTNDEISELGIDELKRIFDFEINRSNTLESKASAALGFVTITITILIFLLNFIISNLTKTPKLIIFAYLSTLSIIFISSSLIYLISVLKIKNYPLPFEYNPNNLRSLFNRILK